MKDGLNCFFILTGVGNHSRGQAALPTAVRSFLSENRCNI